MRVKVGVGFDRTCQRWYCETEISVACMYIKLRTLFIFILYIARSVVRFNAMHVRTELHADETRPQRKNCVA